MRCNSVSHAVSWEHWYILKFFTLTYDDGICDWQCELDKVLQDNTLMGYMWEFGATMGRAFLDMLEHSYVSVAGALILAVLSCLFVPVKVSRSKRIVIGLLHFGAHLTSAIAFMLLLEIGLQTCVRHELLGTSGKVPSYQNFQIYCVKNLRCIFLHRNS